MTAFSQKDFVLKVDDNSIDVMHVVNKYDTFLAAHFSTDYDFLKSATNEVLKFLVSKKYGNIGDLAVENYKINPKLSQKYPRQGDFLAKFQLKDKKACSLDLATGTGKSYVIYALAQIALAEGLVDKVLVLCPSLTIEEGLKDKFEQFSGDNIRKKIIEEGGAVHQNPAIKNANEPILEGDICVENIHAVYERTGSSIVDSFKGKGLRTLVINDEAHHIFSPSDTDTKKWFDFLDNDEFGFHYIVNLSGTPFVEDEYFNDIVFRYSIRDAIDKGVVKKVDYKFEEGLQYEKGFQDSYAYHQKNCEEYGKWLKPITIVVTERIVSCITAWKELVAFIQEKEGLSFEQAKQKVIWVTSSVPGKDTRDGKQVKKVLGDDAPEKRRKENLLLLKTVDDPSNPVEWIVSVSMLTEGWDVKNVFQVVPHENRAFNSKLLISQVLGRGLRIPVCLKDSGKEILLKVNNHEKWTKQIEDLYRDVLEIDNRLSWGYDPSRKELVFPIHNLSYESVQVTQETKTKPASDPKSFGFGPQSKVHKSTDQFSESGEHSFDIYTKDNYELNDIATLMHGYLKMKDPAIAKRWSKKKITAAIVKELTAKGYDSTFLSKENYLKMQQAFGTLMRKTDETNPRFSLKTKDVLPVMLEDMATQSFNEGALKNEGLFYYDDESVEWFTGDQQVLFKDIVDKSANYDRVVEDLAKYGVDPKELSYLKDNVRKNQKEKHKTPLSLVYVSYAPEREFAKHLFNNTECFDTFIKNPDKGFYSFPYSYKPEAKGRTHVRQENFNPDFMIKKGEDVLVIEIKKDGDDSRKNAAKLRDGLKHFEALNTALVEQEIKQRYVFKFLSPADYPDFFQVLKEGSYEEWKSTLMNELVEVK